MDDSRSSVASFKDPLEAHRMVLRHRGTHDKNSVGIGEVLLGGGRATASERCAQTGHSGAVSYARLVGNAYHSQSGTEQLLYKVILLVVEGGAAEMADGFGMHHRPAVFVLDKVALT